MQIRSMVIDIHYKVPPNNFAAKALCSRCERKLQSIPNSWDALAPRQYLLIMGVLNSGVDFHDQLLQITYVLLDVPWNKDMEYYIKQYITTDQLWLFTALANFMEDEKKRLTKNHLPSVRINGKRYYGPSDMMQNISFSQFMDIDHIIMFDDSKQLQKLAKIASIMYLPKGEAYDTVISQTREHQFAKLSQNELYSIGFFFSSVRSQWEQSFTNLFVKGSGSNTSNWAEPLSAMSQDPERLARNSEQRALTVLFQMDQTIKRQKEYEMQQKHG